MDPPGWPGMQIVDSDSIAESFLHSSLVLWMGHRDGDAQFASSRIFKVVEAASETLVKEREGKPLLFQRTCQCVRGDDSCSRIPIIYTVVHT